MRTAIHVAIVGAGPAGLALALLAAESWPDARITLYDARPLDRDVAGDPRTLALAAGSVQLLRRLAAWPDDAAEPILEVHVSQAPAGLGPFGDAALQLRAGDLGVPALGAVLTYGALVAALQRRWTAAVEAAPGRLASCFGHPVRAVRQVAAGRIEIDAAVVDQADLAVIAEGGVFAEQSRKALAHDYRQTAWVGTVTLDGGRRGLAVERFTARGPVALLPLPPVGGEAAAPDPAERQRAALVWCVDRRDDPVAALDDAQRVAVLNTLLPPAAGRVAAIGALKAFPLGLNAERSLVGGGAAQPGRGGRVVRIGNAAQTLHPVAGQGLNLGLRDACALVAALRFTDDLDAALRRVEWSRAPDRWSMIATTDFLARSFTWRLPGLGALRGAALAGLEAAPLLKRVLARRMMFGSR